MEHFAFKCPNCGGTNLVLTEMRPVDQCILDVVRLPDGQYDPEFSDSQIDFAYLDDNPKYWCTHCQTHWKSLESIAEAGGLRKIEM